MKQLEEILGENLADPSNANTGQIAVRLGVAAALGLIIAGFYTYSRRSERRMSGLPQTLLLLCPLITMVTMAVGQNIAAAFTLVGTLAIVRFRTAVRDTRDTVFVIFSVAAGLAMGAFNLRVALVGTAIIGTVALLSRLYDNETSSGDAEESETTSLKLRVTLSPPDADLSAIRSAFAAHGGQGTITRSEVDRRNQRLTVTFRIEGVSQDRMPELLTSLLEQPEVQSAAAE